MTRHCPFSRRDMLRAGGAAALMAAGYRLLAPAPALAKAEKIGLQAPGYFRFNVGTVEVTIVSDGQLLFEPLSLFAKDVPEAQVKALLKGHFRATDVIMAQANAVLLNTGEQLVLIDTGSGPRHQKTAGRLLKNLKASGYEPSDVDVVVLTHAHPGHVWGIHDDFGGLVFPQATYYIGSAEWTYWMDEALKETVPERLVPVVEGAQRYLNPIASKTTRFEAGAEIVPGLVASATPGHTPGHMSFELSSGDQTAIIAGDAIMHDVICFEEPSWQQAIDMDPEQAAATRSGLLDRAASEQLLLICFHLPFPGVGHVGRRGRTYRWMPAQWNWEL